MGQDSLCSGRGVVNIHVMHASTQVQSDRHCLIPMSVSHFLQMVREVATEPVQDDAHLQYAYKMTVLHLFCTYLPPQHPCHKLN